MMHKERLSGVASASQEGTNDDTTRIIVRENVEITYDIFMCDRLMTIPRVVKSEC
jgi:hypothetical protein